MKKADMMFQKRLEKHHDELRWLYMELYGNDSMFAELCDNLYRFYNERKTALKDRDEKREQDPEWFKKTDMLGMMPFLDTPKGRSDGGYAVADFRKARSYDAHDPVLPPRGFYWAKRKGR